MENDIIQITSKFRYGLMVGAIALALLLVAEFASWDCQDEHASLRPPGTLAMQNMQNEMAMHVRQGMPPPPPNGMMHFPFPLGEKTLPPVFLGLNLSESQQDKIFELLHSQEPTMRVQQKAISSAIAEMNQLVTSGHYSPSEVRPFAEKLANPLADSLVLRTVTEAKIRALLTPEQRKQADSRFEAALGHEEPPRQ
jgi:Spy/CpxP family protein refolding chaperone